MNEKIHQALELLGRVFPKETFIRAMPILILAAGLSLFGLSYVAFPSASYPAWHDATKSLGQAITVSGVVSIILNTLTFMGIFREALHEVITADSFLRRRNDLSALWSRVTSVICQGKFPALSEHLETNILARYIPSRKDFYYSEYHRECVIDWFDEAAGIVLLTETISLNLHPCAPQQAVAYNYQTKADSRTPPELATIEIHYLEVDRQSHKDKIKVAEFEDDFGGKGLETSYAIELLGQPSYKIERSLTRKLHLASDPFVNYISDQFILKSSVKIRSTRDNLKSVFVATGTTFQNERAGPDWSMHKQLAGLMFPGQGYIVFVQRV